jgi:hypothetical protein
LDQYVDVRPETLKLLGENLGKTLEDIVIANAFWIEIQWVRKQEQELINGIVSN